MALALSATHLALGCQSARSHNTGTQENATSVAKKEQVRHINATLVTNTAYGPSPAREIRWIIQSREGAVSVGSGGVGTGFASGCTGKIMKNGKVASTFSADAADADRSHEVLVLRGHVVIDSVSPKAELKADQVRYLAQSKLFKAIGHVQIESLEGARGTLYEIWANSDFSKFATPDMFDTKL